MKSLFILLGIIIISFTSCLTLDVETGISGMGNDVGALEVEIPFSEFTQEDSIELLSLSSIDNKVFSLSSVIDSDTENILLKGSGGSYQNGNFHPWIIVKVIITNKSNRPRFFFFPSGLLFRTNDTEYQHGILMSDVFVWTFPYQTRTIYLSLYCINYGKHGSSEENTFTILGTTKSTKIKGLLKRLNDKEINITKYISDGNIERYEEVSDRIQTMIWNMTNHETLLSDEDIDFINNIQEKE
jgi:hypothetical protein